MITARLVRHYHSCANCDYRVKGICTRPGAPFAGTAAPLWQTCNRQIPKTVTWAKKEEIEAA